MWIHQLLAAGAVIASPFDFSTSELEIEDMEQILVHTHCADEVTPERLQVRQFAKHWKVYRHPGRVAKGRSIVVNALGRSQYVRTRAVSLGPR